MKRSRPKRIYQGYQGNRRRRRGSPLPLILILVLAAGAGILLYRHFHTPAPEPSEPAAPPVQEQETESPAEHMTTPSGIPCTLTDFGEEAVYTGDLILVNNQIFYHFPADQEEDLAAIFDNKTGSYYVRDTEVLLAPHALTALNEMMDAFQAQGGSKTVNVVAGYRTREFQQHLLDQSAQRNGASYAQRFVAQPGGSEHHTGLAVDFSAGGAVPFEDTAAYAWLTAYGPEYGFVLRYPAGKEALTGHFFVPQHFRYVGRERAEEMAEKDQCLEEICEDG